jgi:3-methylcrotonyl-CoA carboxylase alpha subunit
MFASLLIANRGEIACRIIRTARRLGLRTVAVYSAADRHALHVEMADEAFEIGPAPAALSYLRGERIVEAATAANAPGDPSGLRVPRRERRFRRGLRGGRARLRRPAARRDPGDGHEGRGQGPDGEGGRAGRAGLLRPRQEPDFLREKAYEIGYPVLIKAVAGGGGKGMRRVDKPAGLRRRAVGHPARGGGAFGDGRVLIEKLRSPPRHIEIQVFADPRQRRSICTSATARCSAGTRR